MRRRLCEKLLTLIHLSAIGCFLSLPAFADTNATTDDTAAPLLAPSDYVDPQPAETGSTSNNTSSTSSSASSSGGQSTETVRNKYESPMHFGLDIQFSPTRFPNYQYTPSFQTNKNFYEVHVAFEWMPIKQYGKFGIGLASGFFVAPDVGVSIDPVKNEVQKATVYVIPVSVYGTYRFDYQTNRKQILVPYIKVGPNASFVIQRSYYGYRKDGVATYKGFEYGGGIEFLLNWLEPSSAASLDRSVGINATYLVAEYMESTGIGNSAGSPDLSGYQFRVGVRFEL